MLVTVDGIVLGRRDTGESSCFLDVLTGEFGVIEVSAKGVKKLNNKNAAAAGLFSYSTFCMSKNGYSYTINSTSQKYSFYKLSSELRKFSLAVYFADVIKYSSASEQKGEELLRFFLITLYRLEKENSRPELIKAVFEFRAACILGFMPDLRACRDCARYEHEEMYYLWRDGEIICKDCIEENDPQGERTLLSPSLLYTLRYAAYSPVEKLYGFSLKGETAGQFYDFCEKYLLMQLGRDFKSLNYYKSIEDI